ncbi:MAG: hypothetical protein ISS69_06500 [Phycisphaerae bacterium]|nr:hypothetical protein [Phycisphaerae bacterium]
MSKASRITILCEDKLQDVFVSRFLKKCGVNNRVYTVIDYPEGKGSGEQHVREKYAKELKAFRTRPASTVLIVIIDADKKTVQARHDQLDSQATSAGLPVRQDNEQIVHVIPKRHIETWLAYLDGNDVNETDKYKTKYQFTKCESNAHGLIDKLANHCRNQTELTDAPDSLVQVCREYDRIRNALT